MFPSDPVILILMTVVAMALLTFWRKVLALLVSAAIAVFVYGLLHLGEVLTG